MQVDKKWLNEAWQAFLYELHYLELKRKYKCNYTVKRTHGTVITFHFTNGDFGVLDLTEYIEEDARDAGKHAAKDAVKLYF